MQKCIVIAGQTGSGKSALAIHIALLLKKSGITSEIISADSRQVYSGFDLSSAKITETEMQGIKHHMLSIADPAYDYTVADYKKDAQIIIAGLHQKNSIPIICGGTGLYIDNLIYEKTIPEVPPNPLLREKLEKLSTEELYTILKKKDPDRAQNIDSKNKRRLIRALEIIEAIGKIPAQSSLLPIYETLYIGLMLPKEKLEKIISKRTKNRIQAGMIQEIESLHTSKNLSYERLASFGMEYKWISLYLQKKITKKDCIAGINKDTLAYAKRQMTWFKKNRDIYWVSMDNKKKAYNETEKLALDFLSS